MRIRRATIDDLPEILRYAQHFVEETEYATWLAPFDAAVITALVQLALDQGVIFLAPGGMVAAVPLVHPMTGQRYVEELAWWVEPERRGGLVGPRLLDALETWAASEQIAFVKVAAPHGQPDVGRFYEHRGYQPVELAYFKRLD